MRFLLFSALTLWGTVALAQPESRMMRFPSVSQDQVVFTFAGDLYTTGLQGGLARKLTSHSGDELFPRLSADGKWIAFSGQYDGNTEVYVIPSEGGDPRRLTVTATLGRDDVADRMGPNNLVIGWAPDDKGVLFRSRLKEFNDFKGQLFLASLTGEIQKQLPLPRGGFATYSPDGKQLAYNQVFREFRTWKRYRGGMADDVWIYDFGSKQTVNLTDHPAQDIIPMWIGDKIYFLSDRDKNSRMNLYVTDVKTRTVTQLTFFTDFDVKFPSANAGKIVFENGGFLYLLNTADSKPEAKKLNIRIPDDNIWARPAWEDVSRTVSNFEISPDGNRIILGARGDVFTLPVKNGPTRNLTQSSGVHERNSKWSPDGKWIAYVSDRSGEDEIYIKAQDGSGAEMALTSGGSVYKYEFLWSPDSKKILYTDRNQVLSVVDVQSKQTKTVAKSAIWEIRDFAWAPDSRWIAYVNPEVDMMNRIFLYSLDQDKAWPVTDGWYESSSPSFSRDGKYLFFVSNRDFNPIYSWTEWNHAYQDMSRIYLVTLSAATDSPFKPKSDEVAVKKDEPAAGKDQKKDAGTEPVNVKVDIDGITARVVALPAAASAYRNLQHVGTQLFYIRQGSKDSRPVLMVTDLSTEKETQVTQASGFELSADGKKMLIGTDGKYHVIPVPSGKTDLTEAVSLSDMKVLVDPKAEWIQIFNESWRQMRDFFYAPNMHGNDWKALKEKYGSLVPHVRHRKDLTYIIGEMIGELNAGHAYVGGGDYPDVDRVKTGLLGAELVRDGSGYYRIARLLGGQNWSSSLRNPLREIGVDAREGDFIIEVNGVSVKSMTNLYTSLIGTVGKQVTLTLNSKPSPEGARRVVVIPIGDEADLYYHDWVQTNIKKVNEATNGKVGYIHVPDMGPAGLNEFVKHFYPQLTKKALIIDVRGNGGGNVSPMLIERLRREAVMINIARNGTPNVNPGDMVWGPKVALADEFSASDGDLFTYRFKAHGLGPVIGKRTWGGTVGIRGSLPFIDGGSLNKPEFSRYDLAGKTWIIEGTGVDPDIRVDNDPAQEFAGNDQQLNKAIEVILDKLKTEEKTIPPVPEYPKR
ncbi:MAG: PD40 domain-containing protein [Bacteroidetes bacterium]|nr:PD40 domain-containing protein [Bacteroidota bacterium]